MAFALSPFGSLRGPNRQSCRLVIRAFRAHPCGAPALRFGVLPWIAALRATVQGSRTKVLFQEPQAKKKTPEGVFYLAGGQGFEPRLTASEAVVLPLDDPPKGGSAGIVN
jgi:hypothetical protein